MLTYGIQMPAHFLTGRIWIAAAKHGQQSPMPRNGSSR
jgi:hypothetical protein